MIKRFWITEDCLISSVEFDDQNIKDMLIIMNEMVEQYNAHMVDISKVDIDDESKILDN